MLIKINCKYFLIPLLVILTFSGLIAQPEDPKFERISLEHGLSQSSIRTIMKDSKGFMWFGTESGLNKYDGYEFVIYKSNPFDTISISNNQIQSTFEDTEGFIWIGTGGGGLNKFNRETETFTHYRHDPQNPNSISSDFVGFAFEDKSHKIWVFTNIGGIDLFNKKTEKFEHFKYNPDDPNSLCSNNIRWVYEDITGNIWFGTANGLNKFNRGKGNFERFLVGTFFSNIYESKNEPGIFWLTTGNIQELVGGKGLIRFDTGNNSYTYYTHSSSNPNSISSNIANQIHESRNGTFWIATAYGLNKFDPSTNKFKTFLPNPTKTKGRYNVILGFQKKCLVRF